MFRHYRKEVALVPLDLVMPKKTGIEAYIDMIRIDKNVKVLLSSGFKQINPP
jgi:hypothetical protein